GGRMVDGRRGRRFSVHRPPCRPRRAQRSVGSAVVGELAVLLDTARRPPRHRILCAQAKRPSHSTIAPWTTTVARLTGPAWSLPLAPGDGPPRSRPRRPLPSRVPSGGRSIGSWLVQSAQRRRDCRRAESSLSLARCATRG